jgi:hypothetical protein
MAETRSRPQRRASAEQHHPGRPATAPLHASVARVVSLIRKLEANWPLSFALMLLAMVALAALRITQQ